MEMNSSRQLVSDQPQAGGVPKTSVKLLMPHSSGGSGAYGSNCLAGMYRPAGGGVAAVRWRVSLCLQQSCRMAI